MNKKSKNHWEWIEDPIKEMELDSIVKKEEYTIKHKGKPYFVNNDVVGLYHIPTQKNVASFFCTAVYGCTITAKLISEKGVDIENLDEYRLRLMYHTMPSD